MTKTKWIALALPALIVLSGCSKPAPDGSGKPPVPPAATATQDGAAAAGSQTAQTAQTAKSVLVPQLAYDDSYDFTASSANSDALLKADQAACDRAGVTQCQMVSLSNDATSVAGYAGQTLELRVTPDWLKTWQGGLDARLAQTHDKLADHKVTSEDLSLNVIDTQAHLKNMTALRDRMLDIVRTRQGKLDELIDVENRLSQVQADIDATETALAVMNARIQTVHLTLTYRSDAGPAADSVFAPVADALKSSVRTSMQVVAMLIGLLAAVLPLGLLAIPVVWYVRRTTRRTQVSDHDIKSEWQ